MKLCYLILAHASPKHLGRLLESIADDETDSYVHFDRKTDIGDFGDMAGMENVHFIEKRVPVSWGGFSLVQATINLLKSARRSGKEYDYYLLLSGTHYPLRPQIELRNHLKENPREFISLSGIPCKAPQNCSYRFSRLRMDHSYLAQYGVPFPISQLLAKAVNYFQLHRKYKRRLGNLKPYSGWQWWVLSAKAIDYILQFMDDNPKIVNYFRFTEIPDESFFQTIIGNSPLKEQISHDLTYTHWTEEVTPHPEYLKVHTIRALYDTGLKIEDYFGEGDAFFARKFNDDSGPVVDAINLQINQ